MDELTERQKVIRRFIHQFRNAARKECHLFNVRGIAGVKFSEDLKEKISISFHMHHNRVYLTVGTISFEEFPYNERDIKGEDHQNINVISLYDKLDMLVRDGELTEVDFEKLLFSMM
jgi:hypothetical protein